MFRKTLVSIYFQKTKLQIVLLTPDKKKIKKYASVDLPDGLIRNHKVQDVDLLAQIISHSFKKVGISQKSIGLIVPEFATFTKTIFVPNLNIAEVNEAVGWQTSELFPDVEDMIIDWKIVAKESNGYSVLVCSIEKDILESYLSACEKAGLFPLVVEIPSVSLVRATQEDKTAKIIIHKHLSEIILVAAQGGKILGSSIVREEDLQEIEKTILRMSAHFKDINLEKLVLSGESFDKSIVEKISKSTNLPATPIELEIENIPKNILTEYIVPVSLQTKDITAPSDPSTINLLPASLVEKYNKAKIRIQAWSLTLTMTLFVWFTFLMMAGAYFYIGQQIKSQKAQASTNTALVKEKNDALSKIKEVNITTNQVLKIKKVSTNAFGVIGAIDAQKPADITVSSYDLDLDKGELMINGVAGDRISLVEFKKRLEDSETFENVQIPISSLEVERDLEFSASFDYVPIKNTLGNKRK